MNRSLFVSVFSLGLFGCTPGAGTVVKTAIDVASYACVLANAESGDETVMEACKIEKELAPAVKELLAQHKKAVSRKMAASKCPEK